ncbi:MAG: YidC/Oxa1 family membrane protein insertase [Chloroflexota bacterium]|jgi:YidC/Oxa1 family membrane protein insertase
MDLWNLIIVQPMLNILLGIYSIGLPFGLAIIIFTIVVRLITHPLTAQQQKSTQAMQELQKSKEWQEMQKKYKNEREKLSQEQMRLYKEMGVNPFGSCLPTLIQFPIIIGLYQSIMHALGNTPIQLMDLSKFIYPFFPNAFKLIPINPQFLWMNLGEPERVYIGGFGIPILAILVMITTYMQSKVMTMPTADANDQSAQMTKMMNLYMPLMLGFFAYSFAAGLAVYFVTSNLVSVFQYTLLGKTDWRRLLPAGMLPSNKK